MTSFRHFLRIGDDLSFHTPSSEISYGRVTLLQGERVTVQLYFRIEIELYDDLSSPSIFYAIPQLAVTSIVEEISINDIDDIIFILSVNDITSNTFHILGISNIFFLRYQRVQPEEGDREDVDLDDIELFKRYVNVETHQMLDTEVCYFFSPV